MKLALFHSIGFAGLISVGAVGVKADGALDGHMTYELFEHTVEHADLAGCPPEFDAGTQFCRMTLADERAHVFVFDLEGDQPLQAVKSYELSEGLPAF
ncbi:MAG: hypothetical protein RID11_05560 [Roseovarius sp.]|jgi:hypothetical protein|uniref:hypothetical protein n=1 Tax=Roseovarius sp. TaxID=1486281 RepID=UPI0032EB2417